jgi:SAM-dependent methyltransferase
MALAAVASPALGSSVRDGFSLERIVGGCRSDRASSEESTMVSSLDPVQRQYEMLPYPARDPADEKKRLLRTWLDDLPMINHYGYAGRQTFANGFRALAAGGGTGDATIFLAEQLKGTNAEIVHLDFSHTSVELARRRAEVRGLGNIRFVCDSLLNVGNLDLGKFDYINSVGVLPHLEDPDAGLKALRSALAEDGVLGLMVYGRVGRTSIYQMQELMRLVNGGEARVRKCIGNTKEILAALPPTNWFKRSEDLYIDHRVSDSGLFDLLLHPRDRAYSVEEIFAWLCDGHGLHLEFTDVQRGRSAYLPHFQLGPNPPRILRRIREMPLRRQFAISELLTGTLQTHSFFATRSADCTAPYGDAAYVPFFFHEPLSGRQLAQMFAAGRGRPVVMDHVHTGLSVTVNPGRYGPLVLQRIDGRASFGEIFSEVRTESGAGASLSDARLFEDFREIYEALNGIDRLLLRHE